MYIKPKMPFWYSNIYEDYNPYMYTSDYDPSLGLYAGDISKGLLNPWKSDVKGYDAGRYLPTSGYGSFGKGKGHYNYAKGIEETPYYLDFGSKLLNDEGTDFTELGKQWALAVDKLLPPGSNATFYDGNKIRGSWTTLDKDAHGRPPQTFNNLKDYVEWVRKDLILGARHNVFAKNGNRYFFVDDLGIKHWVNPDKIGQYNVSEKPVNQEWANNTLWNDYELTGLKNNPPLSTKPEEVGTESVTDSNKLQDNRLTARETGDPEEKPSFWNKLNTNFKSIAPDLLEALRLAGTLHTNDRVYDEMKKAIIPNLLLSYNTHRQVVGDEATKLAYYRRAVQGLTKAAQPFTSDADRQMAYMQEAKRVGDELRALGDLVDNLEIRRTSDESNQHLWGNIQRATEVANNNITELNKAFAAKRQLAAQKKLADWTNIDQFLLGRIGDYKLKKARNLNYAELLLLLLDLHEIATDETLLRLKTEAESAYNNYYKDTTDLAKYSLYRSKLKAYLDYLYELQKRILTRRAQLSKGTLFGKSGVKLTYKDNTCKQLYKISKDIADHFRRISKMTDDSRVRTLPKPIKLSSHPKKMLMGGVAPFYIYRPYGVGSESSMSVSQDTSSRTSSSSSSKDNAGKDKLDMVKELFKAIQGQGLPVDVNTVYLDITSVLNKAKAFGEELSTDDIASMYLNSMLKINNLKYSKDVFDKAKALATANEALNEFAVTTGGKLVLQDMETGKIKSGTYQEFIGSEGKLNPLTNDLLLNLRAYSPNMALWKGDEMMQIVNNGVGMNKIADLIQKLASKLGSNEEKIEGISEVLAHKIKNGLLTIAGFDNTPDGFYKISKDIKDSSSNVQAALNYIMTVLPPNYKTLLDLRSGGKAKEAILSILTSLTNDYYKEDIAPLTGKASNKNSNGSGEKGDSNNSAGLAFVLGQGPREIVDFNTGTSVAIRALGIRGTILNHSLENLGLGSTLQDVSKSQFSFLKLRQATFGGSRLNPGAYSHIMLNDSEIMGVDLPYKVDLNGNTVPDFLKCKLIEKADEIVSQQNITDPNKINEVYQSVGLPPKYNQNGELNTQKYMRFAAILATLDEQALLNKEAVLSDEVLLAGDIERDLYEEAMKKSNKDYSLGNGMWLTGWGKDELYKGTIFIPYDEDIAFAAVSSGRPMKQNLPNNASTVQLMLYAPKSLNYKPQDVTLSQIINN